MTKIKSIPILLFILANLSNTLPQNITVNKIEPPNWWTGMQSNEIQLMIYGSNLKFIDATFNDYRIEILKIHEIENPSYAFIDIRITNDLQPGNYLLSIVKGNKKIEVEYPILKRDSSDNRHQGFGPKDVIYLLFPDRFANGDTKNDSLIGSKDEFEFKSLNGRHGGDIQGITDKLDYLKDLGITSIWITPLLMNDMYMSYHGYAATDLYNIDPRFGTNDIYKKLVSEAHKIGLKIILDHVSNHIGINHHWANNLPMGDWFNGSVENHKSTEHNKIAFLDIHSDPHSINITTEGWFQDYMPDLNQTNPFLAKYINQNTLWWIEYTGLDGIREDTYPYSDQRFMSNWAELILREYPTLNIVGEIWKGVPAFLAKYQKGSFFSRDFDSNLPAVFDFGMQDAFTRYLKGEKGIWDIYENFAKDFVYSDPGNLVIFLDNHDVDRALFTAGNNIKKLKIVLTLLLTTRGIPQLFYGTEIGIAKGEHHGRIRSPFPGGFPGDKRNAFLEGGRTEKENDIFNYLKKLLNLRQNYKSLSIGEMVHFPPEDSVYIYFNSLPEEKIMIIVNDNEQREQIVLKRMKHLLPVNRKILNLFSDDDIIINRNFTITVEGKEAAIFLLPSY